MIMLILLFLCYCAAFDFGSVCVIVGFANVNLGMLHYSRLVDKKFYTILCFSFFNLCQVLEEK